MPTRDTVMQRKFQNVLPVSKSAMKPFEVMRHLVQLHADAIAVETPYRIATYRKMWSRIERSTARLHGEWGIRPGDTIVYVGCGHLDALVMYFAAARCGARVLPLEHRHLQHTVSVAHSGAVLLLHDDDMPVSALSSGLPCKPISSLIATVCRYPAQVKEDSALVSLLEPGDMAGAKDALRQRWHGRSLDALAVLAGKASPQRRQVQGALFDASVFAPVVLSTLLAGGHLLLGPAVLSAATATTHGGLTS